MQYRLDNADCCSYTNVRSGDCTKGTVLTLTKARMESEIGLCLGEQLKEIPAGTYRVIDRKRVRAGFQTIEAV